MVETTGQIEAHIQDTREDLKSNLNELNHKVNSAMDWRQQFEKHPAIMMGVTLAGGFVLARLVSGRKKPTPVPTASKASPGVAPPPRPELEPMHHNLNAITAALIGVAATQAKEFLSKLIPGFEGHLPEGEANRTRVLSAPAYVEGPVGNGQHREPGHLDT